MSRRSPFFGINYGLYAAGFDRFSPYAYVNLSASDPFGFLLGTGDQVTFESFKAGYTTNASLTALLARVTVVDSPYIVVNPGYAGWQTPLDYYQAFLKPIVAGVNMSTVTNTEASWLAYPIAGVLDFPIGEVSTGGLSLMDVTSGLNLGANNISKKFTSQEWSIIVGASPSKGNMNATLYLGGLTALVNGSSILESALIIEYLKYRLTYLGAASTDGLQKLAALYPETRFDNPSMKPH